MSQFTNACDLTSLVECLDNDYLKMSSRRLESAGDPKYLPYNQWCLRWAHGKGSYRIRTFEKHEMKAFGGAYCRKDAAGGIGVTSIMTKRATTTEQ